MLETLLTGTNPFDANVMAFLQERLRTPFGDAVMPYFSYLAELGLIWILISVALLIRRRTRLTGVTVLCAVVLGLLLGQFLLKALIPRDRPFQAFPDLVQLLISPPSGHSFPSGHTAVSFAAATALFLGHKKLGIPALILAALIGFSRSYLFVHWPTDVLAGAVLGVACALLVHYLLPRFTKNVKWLQPEEPAAR